MKLRKGPRARATLIAIGAALVVLSCGGKQSMASKSAAAYREAVAKGTPVDSGGHGGHVAETSSTSMAGMDHGQMSGMDHSKMQQGSMATNMPGMSGMHHSPMQHGSSQSMANMPGMQHGSMAGMSKMPGMQHGAVSVAPPPPAPTNSSGIGRLNPAATLRMDDFDQPSPVAVTEANKAKPPGGLKE